MKLRAEVFEFCEAVYCFIAYVVILKRAYAHALETLAACKFNGIGKGFSDVEAVAAEVDAHEYNFLKARALYLIEFGTDALKAS